MADIKVKADLGNIKKGLQDITRTAKELGKSPIELLSKNTVKLLKGEAAQELKKLTDHAKNLKSEIMKQEVALKKTTKNTKEYRMEMEKLVKLSSQVAKNQSAMGSMKSLMGGLGRGGGGKMGMLRMAGGIMGGGALALGGAAIGYGASKISSGYAKYKQGTGERIQLRGMGLDPNLRDSGRAAGLGMDAGDVRRARISGVGAFGSAGGGEGAALQQAGYERSFGLGKGTFAGLGGSMRGSVGGGGAMKDMQKVMATAMTTGLEDADIGSYLETAVSYLQNIDSSGIKDRGAMLKALADVTKNTGDAPEKIAKGLGGIDSSIAGSTGEQNAFFQQAFSKRGGGSIGGAQFAVEGGLSGMDLGRVAGLSGAQRKQLGGMAGGAGRAQDILDKFKSQGINVDDLHSGKASKQQQVVAGRFAKQMFGAKTSAEGLGQLGLLRQVAKGGPGGKAAAAKLKEASKSLEEKSYDKLKTIAKSNAGVIQKLEAIRAINEEKIGAQASKYYAIASKVFNTIDSGIMGLLKYFGIKSEDQKKREEKGKERTDTDHAARVARGEIAHKKLRSGEKISKLELNRINTKDRLLKKHGKGAFSDEDKGFREKVEEEKKKIKASKARSEGTLVEGAPLQSTADKAKVSGEEEDPVVQKLNTLIEVIKGGNVQREQGNRERKEVPLMLQRISNPMTNTHGGL